MRQGLTKQGSSQKTSREMGQGQAQISFFATQGTSNHVTHHGEKTYKKGGGAGAAKKSGRGRRTDLPNCFLTTENPNQDWNSKAKL